MDDSRLPAQSGAHHVQQSRANRLVLIDGNAILHRAYHALPPLTAPDGSLVNAVYGFTSMLLKIVHDLAPTHLAVAFDRPKPTFRKQLFAGYQAKRPKMDEDLTSQIAKVHDVVAAFGIPAYEVDGYEADDVLATITSQCQMPNAKCQIDQVIIVTGDRDILQLVVDEKVFVYMPTKGLSEAKLYGEKEVMERMGVPPKQIPDFKALAGDASDNYPGVNGIGPKTAQGLLKAFRSIEELYQAIHKKDGRAKTLPETVLTKLAHGAEDAVLSKDLATIRTDVPMPVDLAETKLKTLDTPEARKALEDLHFPSLLKRLGGSAPEAFTEKKRPHGFRESKTETRQTENEQQQLF
ncbi:MAG: 5'-3' exonuclease H3TH domain-containing protein [Patescibacteria group bacterium]